MSKQLEVWLTYEGPRAPGRIDTGVYAADDPRLFGLAVYLVDNGNARWLSTDTVAAESAPEDEPDTPAAEALEESAPEGDETAAGAGDEESAEEPAEDEPDTPTRRRGRRG